MIWEYTVCCLFTLKHLMIYSSHFTSKSISYTMHLLCITEIAPKVGKLPTKYQ